ncbi:MAG: TenA family transcriptional regulator [Candidatus Caldarchaeum sp.]|nr:TenA family transcriptional regulator [Candidatus Caldarchaeum sp.]
MLSRKLLDETRSELAPLNKSVLNHPLLADAESGRLPLDSVKLFVENQLYIVHHDIRSLAVMAAKTNSYDEASYFTKLQNGDAQAFTLLLKMAEELNIKDVSNPRISPDAVAYTHYLAWLALYANPGEQAFALIVNLPVWGAACGRLAKALKQSYAVKNVDFLEFFSETPAWVEEEGLGIVEKYLTSPHNRFKTIAKTIQRYESMFWDAVHRGEHL